MLVVFFNVVFRSNIKWHIFSYYGIDFVDCVLMQKMSDTLHDVRKIAKKFNELRDLSRLFLIKIEKRRRFIR